MFAICSFLFGRQPSVAPAVPDTGACPRPATESQPLIEEVEAIDRGTAWSTRRIRSALQSDGPVRALPGRTRQPR